MEVTSVPKVMEVTGQHSYPLNLGLPASKAGSSCPYWEGEVAIWARLMSHIGISVLANATPDS